MKRYQAVKAEILYPDGNTCSFEWVVWDWKTRKAVGRGPIRYGGKMYNSRHEARRAARKFEKHQWLMDPEKRCLYGS